MSINNKYPNISPSLNLDFTNSNTIDPRITFSRASAATYYDGKTVAKAEENLLKYSQAFDNSAWIKSNSTVTPNAVTAPDGTVTAALVYPISSGARSIIWQQVSSVGRTYTYSIYAKYSGKQWVSFQTGSGGATSLVWWDVLNGVMGSTNGQSASISSAGNGWYRLTITRVADGVFTVWTVCDSDGSDVATVSGTNGVLFWGAQTEERAQVTAYTPTTTQPITNYIPVLQTAPANVPRIDHDPVTGECKGLLIEEQRTNLLTYSDQFDNAAWGKSAATISANTSIAPDGTLTGDVFIGSIVNSKHEIYQTFSATSSTAYTFSFYAKQNGRNISFEFSSATFGTTYCAFDLTAGIVLSGTGAAIQSVGNGWYRCSVTKTATSSGTATAYLQLASGSSAIFTGDGYSGIYIWGAQLEAGAFPTSYIKTEASQVTRAADSAQMTGANFSSWYRQDEGTVFGEWNTPVAVSSATAVELSDGGISNRFHIQPNTAGTTRHLGFVNGSAQVIVDIPGATTGSAKDAFAYQAYSHSASRSGSSVVTSTSPYVPPGLARMSIGATNQGTNVLNGHIKRITYYPKRLSDAQLQALTA